MAPERGEHAAEDPTLLFEEFLARRDEGRAPDPGDYERRAGERLPEFRERLALLTRMEQLALVLADDEDDDVPQLESLGPYRVRGLLGRGGLSWVFDARDPELERDVALKVLSPAAVRLGEARSWMVREGRSLAKLDHPSVVRVYEVAEAQGFAYVAMERVHGTTLHTVLEALRAIRGRDGTPAADEATARAAAALEPIAERCRLVLRIARALAYCHGRGVLHRDLKPGNVLLDDALVPRLIDFGLAHREQADGEALVTARLFGTPAYLAPEQVDAERSGALPASDQFALGVLLYELLTLEHPFARGSRSETLTAISRAAPVSPRSHDAAIHPDVERVCLHALEREPGRRYASVALLADDLEAFLEHRPISLRAPTPWHVARLWTRRHARQVALASAAVGLALLGAGLFAWSLARGERAALLAQVDARRAELERTDEPDAFERLFDWIEGQRYRARELDRSWLAGRGLPAVLPALDTLWRAASARLHERAAPEFVVPWKKLGSAARDQALTDAYNHWQRALNAEHAPADLPGHDPALHEQGGLLLPPGGRLLALGGRPNLPTLVEVPQNRFPESGTYRWMREGPAGLEEVEFVHHGLEPLHAIAPRPQAAFLGPQLVPFSETTLRFPKNRDYEAYELAPFAIARGVVTWAEMRDLFTEPELAPVLQLTSYFLEPPPTGDDDPAVVPWTIAHELARRAGARLPTPVELWHALRSGRLEPGPGLTYEWISTHIGDDGHYLDHLGGVAEQTAPAAGYQDDKDPTARTGFRLARSR